MNAVVEHAQIKNMEINSNISLEDISVSAKKANNKNLIFTLDNELYGIPLSSVKEVIGMVNITPIPHVPPFFKGLINLRGKIMSVIDLRLKLALTAKEYEAKKTSIIITDVNELTIGAIVDDVNEVIAFSDIQIEMNLDISNSIQRDYVQGVAKIANEGLVLLLDIHKMLNPEELALLNPQTGSIGVGSNEEIEAK